jgi:glycosyltransferase involved in cell wall biosynthesis
MAQEILVDGVFLSPRYVRSGTGRYLVGLLRGMAKAIEMRDGPELRVLIPSERDKASCAVTGHPGVKLIPYLPMRVARAWRLGVFLSMVRTMGPEAVFLPSPVPIYFKPASLAVTVHDIIPVLFPGLDRSITGRVLRHSVRSCAAKANLVFTDSEYSKSDIASRFNVPAERIVVTHLGCDTQLFNRAAADPAEARRVLGKYHIEGPYLLHVGAIDPRKNLPRLVRAHQLLAGRATSFDTHLVLCGRLAWGYDELLELVRRAAGSRARVVLTGSVPDRDLAVLFKCAAGYVMPSLYEGFGLPLLESMACGIPVASSNRSSLPEVAGDAAIYFNPESIEEMADALNRLLNGSALREHMIEQGLKRVSLFSWEACARKTLAALRKL